MQFDHLVFLCFALHVTCVIYDLKIRFRRRDLYQTLAFSGHIFTTKFLLRKRNKKTDIWIHDTKQKWLPITHLHYTLSHGSALMWRCRPICPVPQWLGLPFCRIPWYHQNPLYTQRILVVPTDSATKNLDLTSRHPSWHTCVSWCPIPKID